jgi:spore coat protein U-like protein
MTGGGETIDYQMFKDAAYTENWGDTVSTDTVSGTGIGTEQSFTVYGRVPAQTTPATGTYTDTVTVTVTF